ncbi:hypothetical protein ACOME3_002778 [Neoechinorhynchus agilis]
MPDNNGNDNTQDQNSGSNAVNASNYPFYTGFEVPLVSNHNALSNLEVTAVELYCRLFCFGRFFQALFDQEGHRQLVQAQSVATSIVAPPTIQTNDFPSTNGTQNASSCDQQDSATPEIVNNSCVEIPRKRRLQRDEEFVEKIQCPKCQKLFCDMGALRIHFSAGHMNERYQCTKPGCLKIFSQKRSRDRHSANNNPCLHRGNDQLQDNISVYDIITSDNKSKASKELERLYQTNNIQIVKVRQTKKSRSNSDVPNEHHAMA